eukprot:UC4_evm11s179
MINRKEVPGFEAFLNEKKSSKKRRKKKAEAEAKEAEEMLEDIKNRKKKSSKKKRKAGDTSSSSQDSLVAMIQNRRKGGGPSFLDALAAKYAPKPKKGSSKKKREAEREPTEEEFDAARKRLINSGKGNSKRTLPLLPLVCRRIAVVSGIIFSTKVTQTTDAPTRLSDPRVGRAPAAAGTRHGRRLMICGSFLPVQRIEPSDYVPKQNYTDQGQGRFSESSLEDPLPMLTIFKRARDANPSLAKVRDISSSSIALPSSSRIENSPFPSVRSSVIRSRSCFAVSDLSMTHSEAP